MFARLIRAWRRVARVFERARAATESWADRTVERYGSFMWRTWERGGLWRLVAVLIAPVQVLVWVFLLTCMFLGWAVATIFSLVLIAAVVAALILPFIGISAVLHSAGIVTSGESSPAPVRSSSSSGSGFCSTHTCIPSFGEGRGYPVECADGEWSDSGGIQGACSDHGGEAY